MSALGAWSDSGYLLYHRRRRCRPGTDNGGIWIRSGEIYLPGNASAAPYQSAAAAHRFIFKTCPSSSRLGSEKKSQLISMAPQGFEPRPDVFISRLHHHWATETCVFTLGGSMCNLAGSSGMWRER